MKYGLFCNGIQVDAFATKSEADDARLEMPTEKQITGPRPGKIVLLWEVKKL